MNDKYFEATQSLHLFFLTYDYYDKPNAQIFNDWVKTTKFKVSTENVTEIYNFITPFKKVHFSSVVASAEAQDNIYPDIFSQNYRD